MAARRVLPRLARLAGWAAAALGLLVTFVTALVVGVLLHIDFAPLRGGASSRVDVLLASVFQGRIAIDSIGELDLGGIEDANVRLLDPKGALVAEAHGLRARIALRELLESLLSGRGPIIVHLTDVSARTLEFDFDRDERGRLGVERALTPRAPPSGGPAGRGVKVTIDRLDVAHIWVHGTPVNGLPVDADVDAVHVHVAVDPARIAVDVSGLTLATRGMPMHADARGTAEAHIVLPAPSGGAVGVKVLWNGTIAGIPDTSTSSLDGDAIDATIDAPTVPPEAIRALWPASPIDGPATAHLDVHGKLPRLDVHARSTQGDASVDVTGPIVLGAGQTADLHIDARAVDLHTVASAAPITRLGTVGDVSLARSAAGALSGKGTFEVAAGQIAGAVIPKGKIQASFSKEPSGGVRADASVSAAEPGAPTALGLHVAPKGHSYELTFDGDTHVAHLDAVPRLGPVARGQTELKTHGVIDLDGGALNVKLNAEVLGLGHGVMNVRHVAIAAQVHGALSSPKMDITVHGDLLDFWGYKFSGAVVEIHGPATGAHVQVSLDADGDGTPDFDGEGELSIGSITKIDKIKVHIVRASENVNIHVGAVEIAHGDIAVAPIEIDGLGEPIEASFHSSFGAAHLQVKGDGVDLARFGRVSRVQEGLSGCLASMDVDVTVRRDGGDGHVVLELGKCSLGPIEGVSLGVNTTLKGREIAGRAHAEVDDVGSIVLTSPAIKIGGAGSFIESWKQAYGRVKFDGKLDLHKLAARLPRGSLALDHLRGVVAVQGRLERDSPTDDTPGLNLSVTTTGLAIIGPSSRTTGLDGKAVISPPAWSVEGIDVGIDARIDGDSGFAALAGRLNDSHGELISLDVKSGAVPYGPMLDDPSRALELLETVQFNVHAGVPSHDMRYLPAIFALKGFRGQIEAHVNGTGTMLAPVIDLETKVANARMQQGVSFPIDLDLTAHYDGSHATASLVGTDEAAQVLAAHADADVAVADLLHGHLAGWKASGRAHLDALQLDSIVALADRQVTGKVSGDVTLDGLHQDGKATVALTLDSLKVGDVLCPTGIVKAKIDGKTLDASLHLDQTDGSIDASAQAVSHWGTAMLPSLDPSSPPSGEVKAKKFRAALFLPFVDESFTELDGRIDADLKLSVDPQTRRARTQGTVAVSDGRFELASIGGEFHDVSANAVFTPDGVVKLDGLKASAMSGRVEAAATARLDGLELTGANATIQVPASAPLLLTVQGAQVGTVEGKVAVGVVATRTAIKIKAEISPLHVDLPLTSTRDVQALGEMQGVRIGVDKPGGAFVAERLDAPREAVVAPAGKTITLTIVLGNDVLIKRSNELSVGLTGAPVITIGDAVRASGQVRLLGGKIDVQGKSFDIDSGTVTFQGDATDPQVVVTASWTAAEGTKVYAELRGTLKAPKVTLRSEPAYSKNEILSLLIYGSPDSASPNSQSLGLAQGGAAAGVAGGAATQPLNRALENMGLAGVSTRVDTSSTAPRADVEVQIARDLSLQIAEVMGVPPAGTNPDVTLVTLSLRFAKAWSAQATVGNAGTTIWDLVWQHRY